MRHVFNFRKLRSLLILLGPLGALNAGPFGVTNFTFKAYKAGATHFEVKNNAGTVFIKPGGAELIGSAIKEQAKRNPAGQLQYSENFTVTFFDQTTGQKYSFTFTGYAEFDPTRRAWLEGVPARVGPFKFRVSNNENWFFSPDANIEVYPA